MCEWVTNSVELSFLLLFFFFLFWFVDVCDGLMADMNIVTVTLHKFAFFFSIWFGLLRLYHAILFFLPHLNVYVAASNPHPIPQSTIHNPQSASFFLFYVDILGIGTPSLPVPTILFFLGLDFM